MKKIIIALLIVFSSNAFFAQTAFDKFEGQDGVASILVNKKMFDLMSKVKMDTSDKETQQYLNLIKGLDNLKVFTTSNPKITADMKLTSDKYLKSAGLEELMRVSDGNKNTKIYVKSGTGDSQIKELLMFIDGANKTNETVLMSLTGNFDLNDISALTDKMRIPGGDDLRKATNKK